jgi:hypothetical protein
MGSFHHVGRHRAVRLHDARDLAQARRHAATERRRQDSPWLILSHFLLAASGLVVWIVYLAADKDALKWIAFAILAVVALLGWTMFFGWARQRSAVAGPDGGAAAVGNAPMAAGAELRFPIPVVVLHGLFAVTTVVLVFLTAIDVGTS